MVGRKPVRAKNGACSKTVCVCLPVCVGSSTGPLGRKFKDNYSANRIKHSLVNHKLILSRAVKGKQPGFSPQTEREILRDVKETYSACREYLTLMEASVNRE